MTGNEMAKKREGELGATEIERVWARVYGNPAWSVKKGHGSFLTLEFGTPSLQIREPIKVSPHTSESVRDALTRRRTHVVGEWHLWIYCCNWSILFKGQEAAHSESPDSTVQSAVERLDGQRITSVSDGPLLGSWCFTFDQGGTLTTSPYEDDPSDEQWLLYERESGWVLTARADNHYSYGPSDQRCDEQNWKKI